MPSDEARNCYISVFKRYFGNTCGKPEDKFITLGSPKFDKIVNAKKEDYILPSDWSKIIGAKKVILVNTSLTNFLNNCEACLKKLEWTLNAFKNQNNIVPWLRPHPLTEITLKSMRPHMLCQYSSIIQAYETENYGIYDTTPNLARAIAWADGGYSYGGSLLSMMCAAGVPVLWSKNMELTPDIKKYHFPTDDEHLKSMHYPYYWESENGMRNLHGFIDFIAEGYDPDFFRSLWARLSNVVNMGNSGQAIQSYIKRIIK